MRRFFRANEVNPHYQRLTVTYRKFFEQGGIRGAWLILIVITGLLYWQGSYDLFCLLPIIIYGFIGILSIETARFVTTDRQSPIYEMTLLSPITAETIVAGYRQMAFARTARWLGLKLNWLVIVISAIYLVLAYKMAFLVEMNIQKSLGQTSYFDKDTIHYFVLIVFTGWLSFLISTFLYYLLMIEVGIDLGLRFDNWLFSVGASLVTVLLVWSSNLIVLIVAGYVASLFVAIHEFIAIAMVILGFCAYPLYWQSVFRERAINTIRADEKPKWSDYVDVA